MILETEVSGLFGTALIFSAFCVIVAFIAAGVRLVIGPTLADRVVALDLISMLIVVFLVLFKMISGVDAYIYVAIALSLIAFLATVAFAQYIQRAHGKTPR